MVVAGGWGRDMRSFRPEEFMENLRLDLEWNLHATFRKIMGNSQHYQVRAMAKVAAQASRVDLSSHKNLHANAS